MLARSVARVAKTVKPVRFMATQTHHDSKEIVIPTLVDSLEWVLSCPTPVHQFEEPPAIIEIEHLKNLKFEH